MSGEKGNLTAFESYTENRLDNLWDKTKELKQRLDLFVETEDYSIDIGRIYKRIEALELKLEANLKARLPDADWLTVNNNFIKIRSEVSEHWKGINVLDTDLKELKTQKEENWNFICEHMNKISDVMAIDREVLRELIQGMKDKPIPDKLHFLNYLLEQLSGELSVVEGGNTSCGLIEQQTNTDSKPSHTEDKTPRFCDECEKVIMPLEGFILVRKEDLQWLFGYIWSEERNYPASAVGIRLKDMREKYLSHTEYDAGDLYYGLIWLLKNTRPYEYEGKKQKFRLLKEKYLSEEK